MLPKGIEPPIELHFSVKLFVLQYSDIEIWDFFNFDLGHSHSISKGPEMVNELYGIKFMLIGCYLLFAFA